VHCTKSESAAGMPVDADFADPALRKALPNLEFLRILTISRLHGGPSPQ
jgi:hypothetical protein